MAASRSILAHSPWDIVPVAAGMLHLAAIVGLFLIFPLLPWWGVIACGLLYAYSITWNHNSIAHNFVHNPYFTSPALNRGFALILSLTLGYSQTDYHYDHLRHHAGNSDRPDDKGETLDPFSIYRFGRGGQAENVLRYMFASYMRDTATGPDPFIGPRRQLDRKWGKFEMACVVVFYGALAILDWHFVVCMLLFNYLGHSLSALNGFYEHFRGNPDVPMAWGVSSYSALYNWLWMNNGYHAEHHYRPKQHWTKMKELHRQIADQQKAAGVHVLRVQHALGFLERKSQARDMRSTA
jgi:fatty acid desaturase